VEGQTAGQWIISSLPVTLSADTLVEGEVGPGDSVIVIGTTRPQGDILASEILLHTYQLVGPVEQQSPSDWVVAGQPLRIVPASQIQQDIHPGDVALVLVEVQPNGNHVALVILNMRSARQSPDDVAPDERGNLATPASPGSPEADAEEVEFTGTVEDHQGPIWIIAGRTLLQTSESDIRGEIAPGDRVRVRALDSGTGGLILLRIEKTDDGEGGSESESGEQPTPEDPEQTPSPEPSNGDDGDSSDHDAEAQEIAFSGTITSIAPGEWEIAGRTLRITEETDIDDGLEIGDEAEVRALRYPDGHLVAQRIEGAD
jgi:hypothetical protein